MLDLLKGVVSLQKNSFIDFPGRASALLFYAGCNLNCQYCHNAPLHQTKIEPDISHEEIIAYLTKQKAFLDGVVITGGEPTLYNTLPALVEYLRTELGYDVKLDSNGLNPEQIAATNWNYLALDIKTTFDCYSSILGAKGDVSEVLLKSIQLVKDAGENAEIRITCAPGIVNKTVITKLLPYLDGVKRCFLQPFKYSDDLLDSQFFVGKEHITNADLDEYKAILHDVIPHVEIRGR